jgi:hypothetical protein
MITKFKLYESINVGEPMAGDVICKSRTNQETAFKKYVDNNIGDIVEEFKDETHFYGKNIKNYMVKFTNPTKYVFNRDDILYWSKNKEDMEDILQAKRYNL